MNANFSAVATGEETQTSALLGNNSRESAVGPDPERPSVRRRNVLAVDLNMNFLISDDTVVNPSARRNPAVSAIKRERKRVVKTCSIVIANKPIDLLYRHRMRRSKVHNINGVDLIRRSR